MKKDQKKIGILFSNLHGIGGASSAEISYYNQLKTALSSEYELVLIFNQKLNNILEVESQIQQINIRNNIFSKFFIYFTSFTFIKEILSVLNIKYKSNFEKQLINKNIFLLFSLGINPLVYTLQSVPYITFIWDVGHKEISNFPEIAKNDGAIVRESMYDRNISRARAIIVESEIGKKNIEYYYRKNPKQILVAPFVPNLSEEDLLNNTKRKKIALYPAQFWPHKNHQILVKALRHQLDNQKMPRKIIFTGSDQGNLNTIFNLARELEVDDYIDLCGFVDKKELYSLYQKCDLVVMPSILGPTNFPPLEALFFGAAVATATDYGFLPEIREQLINIPPFDYVKWGEVLDLNNDVELPERDKVVQIYNRIWRSNTVLFKKLVFEIHQEMELY